MNHKILLHRQAREEALPLPSRTHPHKQSLVIYTEELTHLIRSQVVAYPPGKDRRVA